MTVFEIKYTYAGWIEAFQIFSKYADDDNWIDIAVEHDEIYAGPNPEIVTLEDNKRLEELGWNVFDDSCFKRFV